MRVRLYYYFPLHNISGRAAKVPSQNVPRTIVNKIFIFRMYFIKNRIHNIIMIRVVFYFYAHFRRIAISLENLKKTTSNSHIRNLISLYTR